MAAVSTPAMLHSSTNALTVPMEGSATVVGILCTVIARRVSSIRTRSVCVPPMSTPTLSIWIHELRSEQVATPGDAAIDGKDRAGHKARAIGGGEHDHVGDLLRLGGT